MHGEQWCMNLPSGLSTPASTGVHQTLLSIFFCLDSIIFNITPHTSIELHCHCPVDILSSILWVVKQLHKAALQGLPVTLYTIGFLIPPSAISLYLSPSRHCAHTSCNDYCRYWWRRRWSSCCCYSHCNDTSITFINTMAKTYICFVYLSVKYIR